MIVLHMDDLGKMQDYINCLNPHLTQTQRESGEFGLPNTPSEAIWIKGKWYDLGFTEHEEAVTHTFEDIVRLHEGGEL